MVALHVCQVWWTLAYKPLRTRRHKSGRTLCQGRTVRACVHSVGMLCGYMPNSSLLYSAGPVYGINLGIPKSPDLGIPIQGFSGLKFAIRKLLITPFGTAIYHLLINGVNAYPCSRLLIIFGYFWTTWNCYATSVFSNLNPKTNGRLSKLRLWHLHSSFRLLSATQWLEYTQYSRYCVYSQERDLYYLEVEAEAFHRMRPTFC